MRPPFTSCAGVWEVSDLLALAERVEALSGPDRDVNEQVLVAAGWFVKDRWLHDPQGNRSYNTPDVTASLDAAMALVPGGWALDCLKEGEVGRWYVNLRPRDWVSEWQYSRGAANPALALTAAALRARLTAPEDRVATPEQRVGRGL